jgi:hypothetical protein
VRSVFPMVLWLIVLAPAVGHGQVPVPGPVDGQAFETLEDKQWVRVAVTGEGRQVGRVLDRDAAALILSAEPQPSRVPIASVDSLWTRRSNAKTGAILGALLGAGLGVVAATSMAEYDIDRSALWVGSLGVGTAGGALLGALLGAAAPGWQRRYP